MDDLFELLALLYKKTPKKRIPVPIQLCTVTSLPKVLTDSKMSRALFVVFATLCVTGEI